MALFAAMLAGCIPGRNIVPPSDISRFVLKDDAVKKYPRRYSFGNDFVVGLKRGEYVAVGRDDDGVYYRGPQDCFVYLIDDLGDNYLATGQRPSTWEVYRRQFGLAGSEGGVYVPYDSSSQPTYFFYMDFRAVTGEVDSRIPSLPESSVNRSIAIMEMPGPPEPAASLKGQDTGTKLLAESTARSVVPGYTTQAMQTQQAGAALGVAIGKSLGTAAQRDAQGKIQLGPLVSDERILLALKRVTRTPSPGLADDGKIIDVAK